MSPRLSLSALLAVSACAPEPASSVELRQTITEVVDLGRALAIEQTAVALSTDLDPAPEPAELAAQLLEDLAASTPCAALSAYGETGLRVDFGPPGAPCSGQGPDLSGSLRIVFTTPTAGERLATLTHLDLGRAGATLTGTTQITWGPDGTRQVVSELRLDSPEARQLEIQSDRIQADLAGGLKIDGWQQWQTLMGRWKLEIGGYELAPGALVPAAGVASVDTPYEHDVYLDFTGEVAGGLGVRANGGRRDHVFAVDANGKIVDLGED